MPAYAECASCYKVVNKVVKGHKQPTLCLLSSVVAPESGLRFVVNLPSLILVCHSKRGRKNLHLIIIQLSISDDHHILQLWYCLLVCVVS